MAKRVAMTLVEGRREYKVDVDIILNNGQDRKNYVLRTCLDEYDAWKAKHCVTGSPFRASLSGTEKKAAIIDNEIWVFGVNGTVAQGIVIAVQIAMNILRVSAQDILGDVYVKNLNAEGENEMSRQVLVEANKELYSGVCQAIREAARILGCTNPLNF